LKQHLAFITKIKAMSARFVTRAEFEDLSRVHSVDELGRRIRELEGYSGVFGALSAEGAGLHRNPLERTLTSALFDDMERMTAFATDFVTRAFIYAYFISNEIKTLKLLMGLINDKGHYGDFGYSAEEIKRQLNPKEFANIDKLLASKDLGGFISALEGTRYYKPLAGVYRPGVAMFDLEVQLDLFYYMNLWTQRKKLPRGERRAVTHIIGTQIDMRNIMWIYRFKRYYKISPERIYASLIPVNYRLRAGDISQLAARQIVESQDALSQLLIPPYNSVFKESTTLEYDYYKKMLSVCRTAGRAGSAVVSAISYLFLKELEINNLTSLIECVRYGLGPKEILSGLYLPEEGEVT
jgi:V/A-type H+-transporting ATPase subunit C